MLRIDAHQHFWVYDPDRDSWITEDMGKIRRDFLPGDLAPLLKDNKIDGCVAVQAAESLAQTDFLLELARKNDFIKAVVGWIDLKYSQLAQTLEQYKDAKKLAGFRHTLQGEAVDTYLADGQFEKGVKLILEKGYSYDLLIFHHQIASVLPMVRRLSENDNAPFVLDHLGKPDLKTGNISSWKDNIRQLAAMENVYCKVSGMVTEADWNNWTPDTLKEALDTVLEAFGPKRLMFGSDWPVCLVATSYPNWLQTAKNYFKQLSETEQEAIFGGNACQFYGIKD